MAKFPTYEEIGKKVAEEVLDGYIYKGKTLREWIDILSQTNGTIINRNICESCTNNGCIFQSGIIRNHCDFYMTQSEE